MYSYDVLGRISKLTGITGVRISQELGKSKNYVSAAKAQKVSPSCVTFAKILAICGYELVAVPENDVPAEALVIDA